MTIKNFKEHKVFRRFFTDTPTWDQFLKHLDGALRENPVFAHNNSTTYSHHVRWEGIVRVFAHYYFVVETLDERIRMGELNRIYPLYGRMQSTIASMHPSGIMSRPVMLICPITGRLELNKHADASDQFHVVCVGHEKWSIYVSDTKIKTYILNPGDLIFVPAHMQHHVTSVTPRAGITWSANLTLRSPTMRGSV